MKAMVLAAGYATRMYPLTLNKPKSLLPVGEKLVIEHIIDRIGEIREVDEILVVTNQKFFSQFQEWLKRFRFPKKIEVLNDETLSNRDRLGAIKDIEFAIIAKELNCDLLVIAGDNLFEKKTIAEFFEFSKKRISHVSIGLYDVGNRELAKKFGVVEIDNDNRIVNFQEKPSLPKSSLAAKCLYFFPKDKLKLIGEYLKTGDANDAPGYYIEWLSKREDVFGFICGGSWYDIGDIASYQEARKVY